MPTLFELKQSLGMIGQQLSNKNEELSKQASNPNVNIKDIEQLKREKKDYNNVMKSLNNKLKKLNKRKS